MGVITGILGRKKAAGGQVDIVITGVISAHRLIHPAENIPTNHSSRLPPPPRPLLLHSSPTFLNLQELSQLLRRGSGI